MFFKNLAIFAKSPLGLISDHINFCLTTFDPIIKVPSTVDYRKRRTFDRFKNAHYQATVAGHWSFLIPFIVFVAHFLDNLYLVWLGGLSPETGIVEYRQLLYYLCFPIKFYTQGAIMMGTVCVVCFAMYYSLWTKAPLKGNYRMWLVTLGKANEKKLIDSNKIQNKRALGLIVDGQLWDERNAQKIITVYRLFKKVFQKVFVFITYGILESYFMYHFCQKFQLTNTRHVLMFFYIPLCLLYIGLGKLLITTFF